MLPPQEPKAEDCCNSGCNPCIFDVYEQQLKRYKKYLTDGLAAPDKKNGISQLNYTEFHVTAVNDYCPSHKLIKFKHSKEERIHFKPGDHFLIKCFSENPCTRAYTPVKNINEMSCDNNEFIVVVKNCGLVSNYLCSLVIGDKAIWRGPYGSFKLTTNQFKRMILLAHGTAIASFMTIIDELLNCEECTTRIFLYFCCKNMESILFRHTLLSYQSFWNFNYKVFLSSSQNSSKKYNEPVFSGKLSDTDLDELIPFTINDQFLLCGSVDFMEYYKSKLLNKGVEVSNIVTF